MNLARNTAVTTLSSLLAVASGVILDGITVAVFGFGIETDAYFIASLLPLAVITIVNLQAGKVVQPLFIHAWSGEGALEAWRFLRVSITIATSVLLLLGLVCLPIAPFLMKLQAPGSSESTLVLAARLCLLFFLIPTLYAPTILMKEALTALGNFGVPGSLKLIENVFKIAFTLLLVRTLGVFALPVGMVAGAMAQLGVVYVALNRRGFAFRPAFHLRDAKVKKALALIRFPTISHFSSVLTEIVQNMFASLAGAGSVSALRLSTRIVDALAGLLVNSIVVVIMPMVTHNLANNDSVRMKANIRDAIRLLLLLSIPASAWLLIMNGPLITALFQRMRFSASDTELVSSLLVLMIPYILFSRLFSLAETGFYGGCDTRTPVLVALSLNAVYLGLMAVLFAPFSIHALPVARSLSYLFGAGLMLYLLRRKYGSLGLGGLNHAAVKVVAATGFMALCILIGRELCEYLNLSGTPSKVVNLALPSLLGFIGLAGSCVSLKIVNWRALRPVAPSPKVAG